MGNTAAESVGSANEVAGLLLASQQGNTPEASSLEVPAYCLQVKSRTGNKPSQAWVMMNPELNPEKQRVLLRCNARLDLQQTQQVGEALIEMAGRIDATFSEPRIYQKPVAERCWQVSWPNEIHLTLRSSSRYPVTLEGSHPFPAKMSWEIGSHLLQIVRQQGMPR